MRIKGAIFDADGTLLDSMPIWLDVSSRWLLAQGIRPEPQLGDKLFSMTMAEGVAYLRKVYGLSQDEKKIVEEINAVVEKFYLTEVALKPGVLELLDWLRGQKIPMAVATATDEPLIAGALAHVGIDSFFGKIFTCGGVGVGKDHPLIYQKAAESIGTKPEETLVFEDALHGLLTAKRAGFYTVGIYDEVSSRQQESLEMHADLYGKDFNEILKKLQKL